MRNNLSDLIDCSPYQQEPFTRFLKTPIRIETKIIIPEQISDPSIVSVSNIDAEEP